MMEELLGSLVADDGASGALGDVASGSAKRPRHSLAPTTAAVSTVSGILQSTSPITSATSTLPNSATGVPASWADRAPFRYPSCASTKPHIRSSPSNTEIRLYDATVTIPIYDASSARIFVNCDNTTGAEPARTTNFLAAAQTPPSSFPAPSHPIPLPTPAPSPIPPLNLLAPKPTPDTRKSK